ncbi:hypothetical protein FQN50_008814 [Emmonsiellopsis sp. PD_5]|nr:hypothetical protein FQN50_008814 [Emmonsiellopsis sp. PD_5]
MGTWRYIARETDDYMERHRDEWKLLSRRDTSDATSSNGGSDSEHEQTRETAEKSQVARTDGLENTPSPKDYHDELRFLYAFPDERAQGRVALVTGEPGIGKTEFLLYLLWRLLGEEISVLSKIESSEDDYVLFSNGHAYLVPPSYLVDSVTRSELNRDLWVLVDSMAFENGLPSELKKWNGISPMLVYTTSPRASRWPKAQFSMRESTLIMDPWTRWEAELLIKFGTPKDELDDDVNELWKRSSQIYDCDGPVPRLFHEYQADRLSAWRRERRNVLAAMDHESVTMILQADPYDLTWADSDHVLTTQSHKLVLVQRARPHVFDGSSSISIITESVKTLLMDRILSFDYAEVIQLLKVFSEPGETKSTAGWIFESFCLHQMSRKAITLTLCPMSKGDRADARYRSNHGQKPNGTIKIRTRKLRWKIYDHAKELDVEENIIYKPLSRNEEPIDAFFIAKGVLYMLQFTLGKTHTVGTPNFQKLRGIPAAQDRRHVFVVKGTHELRVSSKGFNCSLPPYTTIFWPREL